MKSEDTLTHPAQPGIQQQILDPFVGIWNTTGVIKGNGATPNTPINGTDVYEWLPGGFSLGI
jgi:hypothetical protein